MMLQDHDHVDVKHGFWKGLNSQNLSTIFAGEQEEPRRAEVALLEDYDLLFGQRFRTSQRDIRPNVQSFSVELDLLVENPSDMMESVEISDEDDGEDENVDVEGAGPGSLSTAESSARGGELAKYTMDEILYIRRALNTAPAELQNLEQWLLECLCHQWDGDQRKILSSWCSHWEEKARGVDNYQDQIIVRSLFLDNLQRLKELHKITSADMTPWSTAFMLLDMLDWGAPYTLDDVEKARDTLSHLVPFQDCEEANKELRHLVEGASSAVESCFTSLCARQAVYLYRFTKSSLYYKQWRNVFLLDAVFTRVIVEGSRHPVLDGEEVKFWRGKTDIIVDEGTAKSLDLTSWQIRALLLPGAVRPLTETQSRLFRERFCPELEPHRLVDPFELKPQPITHSTKYPDAVQREHHDLYRLFGSVREPPGTSSVLPQPQGAPRDKVSGLAQAQGPAPAPAASDAASTSTSAPVRTLRGGSSRSTSAGLLAPPARFARPADMPQPPSPRPSSGHASPCREPSPTRGTARKKNPFTGKSMFKRGCSPHSDERTPKAPNLARGYVTRAEVTSELEGLKTDVLQSVSQMRDEVASGLEQLKRLKTEVLDWQERLATTQKEEVLAAIRAHQAVTQDSIRPLAMHKEEILSAVQEQRAVVQDALKPLATEKEEILDTIRLWDQQAAKDLQIVTRQVGNLHQTIKAQDVQDALARLATAQKEEALSMEERLVAKQKAELLAAGHSRDSTMRGYIQQQTEALQETMKAQRKPPSPGQDGYLSQCLAPDEWTSSQQDYESMLLRAAWLYIHILGNPDEGVLADAKAWEEVAERYPALSGDHFETALNHVHMQAFGRLFKYD